MALTNHILPDSPTNNFCTLNPLSTAGSTTTPITISDGNLKTVHSVTGQWQGAKGTISVSSGIWYFEVFIINVPTGTTQNYNIGFYNADIHNSLYYGLAGNLTFGANASTAQLYVNTSYTSYGSLGSNGSIYMFCLDVDSEKFWVGLNGSWFASGNPSTGVNPSASGFGKANWTTVQSDYTYSGNGSFQHNYGQDPTFGGNTSPSTTYTDANGIGAFYYQPPTGAKALCTANLPDFTPTVTGDTPQEYFKAVIWGGNNTSQNITDVGFQPDLVWWKGREPTQYSNNVTDSIRGTTKQIFTDLTVAEETNTTRITGWLSNGFSIGNKNDINTSGQTYVAWCWKAGGNSNTFNINGTGYSTYSALQTANTSLPASSTSGMIVPSGMSINTDAGFSIVKYTGTGSSATVPHGLNSAPEMIICKTLDQSIQWVVYHKDTGPDGFLGLNTSLDFSNDTDYWGTGTGVTNTSFGLQNAAGGNNHTSNLIAYCWHSVEGYSKFGSYTGNGSADGPFVYCGFRPAFVLTKDITAHNWEITDSARDTYNVSNKRLFPSNSNAESSSVNTFDFLSNGFKVRGNHGGNNLSGNTHIFMAFAEQPFKFSNAR